MIFIPVAYVPDGPVTSALKKRVKRRRPRPALGNLGPLLDENLVAARKQGHFLYRPSDLRLLKGVRDNPEVVDEGFEVLRVVMADKGIAEPECFIGAAPYYQNVSQTLWRCAVLAAVMTLAITAAVLLGQNDQIAAMVVAISAISVVGAGVCILILDRSVVRVGEHGAHRTGN